jgi:uncharacterized membrane protein YjjP (DUF1212 family)
VAARGAFLLEVRTMLRAVAAVHFLVGVFSVACALLEGSDWWVGYATAFIASGVGLLLADIAS